MPITTSISIMVKPDRGERRRWLLLSFKYGVISTPSVVVSSDPRLGLAATHRGALAIANILSFAIQFRPCRSASAGAPLRKPFASRLNVLFFNLALDSG
ncbi:MAG: hypothetical protein WD065_06935, partial [Planctomycetaceae bacterium]